jgi:mannitol-1-/sugar-/sorbitol-6-phosphatase
VEGFGCDAILFDLDGVLVDSTALVVRTWSEWAARRGLNEEYLLEIAHGRRAVEIVRHMTPDLDAEAEVRELEGIEVENVGEVLEIEGARELLSSLPRDGWTVVTSGGRRLAVGRLEHLGLPVPERIVTADDVANGKPHPEPYLKGAEVLGARPEACVVIEDAPSGVRAAKEAGMKVVAIAATYSEEDLSEADAVVGRLKEIRVVRRPESGADGRGRFEVRVAV